jgi:hypothetical protein
LRLSLAALAGGLICMSLASGASAAPRDPLSGEEVGAIGQVCASVLGLEPNEAQYGGCVDSLSASAQSLGRAHRLWRAQSDCLGEGHRADTPELAECEVTKNRPSPVAIDGRSSGSASSYFYASPTEVRRREQEACAHLGLDRADEAFSTCVENLQTNLFETDNPL